MKCEAQTPKITVAIRKRPLNKKQIQKGQADIIKVNQNSSVVVSQSKTKVDMTKYIEQTTFNFDYAFDESSTNQQIYDQSIKPLIQSAFKGAKITCFAYGQTGSGKTFTMKGDISKGIPGLYFLGANDIFFNLKKFNSPHLQVFVTFYEIYCGKLYDLLNNRNQLKIRQDNKANINVIGMQQKCVSNANEFLELIEYGSNFRVTSQNASNADSSRSHAILQITIKDGKKVFTKISFIDLAGNQRGADHMDQNKQTKIDGAQINKSLLSLKQCIRALDQGKVHTPFRGSKLTMVLKDSFVGFCKTIMIGNISPSALSSENTMNTLRYADRVKQLKKPSDNEILTKEEALAKELMLPRNNKNVIKVMVDNNDDQEDILLKKQQAKKVQGHINVKQGWKKSEKEKMDIQYPNIQLRKTQTSKGLDPLYDDIKSYQHNLERKSMHVKNDQSNNARQGQSLQHQSYQCKILNKCFNPSKNNSNHTLSNGNISYRNISHNKNQKMEIDQNNANNSILTHIEESNPKGNYYNHSKIIDPRTRNFGFNNLSVINNSNIHSQPLQTHFNNNHHYNHLPFQPYYHIELPNQQSHNYRQLRNSLQNIQQQIRKDYDSFIYDHSNLLHQQSSIVQGEMKVIQSHDAQPIDYIKMVENAIDKRLGLLTNFRSKLSFLRDKINESQQIKNKIKLMGDGYHTDEQLLEGLPGDYIINKLF